MNKEVTLRQITFMYLFISLSPIIRQIPTALAGEAGRSGYLSPLWSLIAVIPLTAIIILLMKSFPGLNIYEIMIQLLGKFLAKIFIFIYLLWILLAIAAKVNAYSFTLQFTLMPQTKPSFFYIMMSILVFYALLRGAKTVFRFSEFTLSSILLLFLIILVSSLSKLRTGYLLPISTTHIVPTVMASKNVIAVGGNIIIALFFADKLGILVTKSEFRKLWSGVFVFTAITFLITLFTFGITGADLTANLPFPFYIMVKSISFFNIFERFEVIVTIISVMSDFIAICIFSFLLLRCFGWLFDLKDNNILAIPLIMIVFYLAYYISSTQFEFNFLYRNIIIYLNMIFQFLIPFFLAFICLLRRKKIKKQY